MKECFKCGASEGKEILFEAVHSSGIVNICKACYFKLRIPIIDRKSVDWDEIDNSKTSVRDRLSNMAHVNVQDRSVKNSGAEDLRSVVEASIEKPTVSALPKELIDNFNWIIMRKRRALKITQKQLGKKVGVAEVIIRALEKGVLPRDYKELLPRLENIISAALIRGNEIKFVKSSPEGFQKKVESMRILGEGEKISAVNSKADVLEEKKEGGIRGFLSGVKKKISFDDHEEFTLRTDDFKPEDLSLSTVREIVGEPVEDSVVSGVRSEVRDREMGKSRNHEIVSDKREIRSREVQELRKKSFDSRFLGGEVRKDPVPEMRKDVRQAIEELENYKPKVVDQKLENWNSKTEERAIDDSNVEVRKLDVESQVINRLKENVVKQSKEFSFDALSLDDALDSEVESSSSELIDDDLFIEEASNEASVNDEELSEDDIRKLSWGG